MFHWFPLSLYFIYIVPGVFVLNYHQNMTIDKLSLLVILINKYNGELNYTTRDELDKCVSSFEICKQPHFYQIIVNWNVLSIDSNTIILTNIMSLKLI